MEREAVSIFSLMALVDALSSNVVVQIPATGQMVTVTVPMHPEETLAVTPPRAAWIWSLDPREMGQNMLISIFSMTE